MIFNIMIPGVEIITPIRDLKLSREAEIEYLNKHGVEYTAENIDSSNSNIIIIMSNGGFDGIYEKLIDKIKTLSSQPFKQDNYFIKIK